MHLNRRVLVVHPRSDYRDELRPALDDQFDVHLASSVDEARAVCGREGPFAAALVHLDAPGAGGIAFLRELQRYWPGTTRLFVSEDRDLDLVVHALHEGEVFRFLADDAEPEVVEAALDAAVERHQQYADEQLLTAQLEFTRASLLDLTEALEARLHRKAACLTELERFSADLRRASSLDEVARVAAEACHHLLGGRGVRVLLRDSAKGVEFSAERSGGANGQALVHLVESGDGEVGRIEVDGAGPGNALGEEDRHLIETLASAAGVAAGNLIHRRERDDAHTTTIFALARLAENRDDDTGKHIERVSDFCRLLAEGLREDGCELDVIDDAFVRDLVMSAPLHDIGKVGIPDSILLKPGKLTPDEWEVMRSHTIIGAETLARILENSGEQAFLRMGHDIALYHHEKWDGSGYPHGLRGSDIPLAARILALADCYDALTTRRPYKEPWSHEKALELILSEKGRHFDPRVVEAFERRADEADRIRREKADETCSRAA